jgi:hypothetical protein
MRRGSSSLTSESLIEFFATDSFDLRRILEERLSDRKGEFDALSLEVCRGIQWDLASLVLAGLRRRDSEGERL